MNRKSSDRSHYYRPGTSRNQRSTVTFRQQMTDFARGDLLQELRSQARVSRESVAAEIGVTTKTLYTWEKQNGPIKWDNAKRLAAYYNVDPDHLVTRDSDEAAGLPSRVQLDRIEQLLKDVERRAREDRAQQADRLEQALARVEELVTQLQDADVIERSAVAAVRSLPEWPAAPGAAAEDRRLPARGSQRAS